jgi:hypothetical protein
MCQAVRRKCIKSGFRGRHNVHTHSDAPSYGQNCDMQTVNASNEPEHNMSNQCNELLTPSFRRTFTEGRMYRRGKRWQRAV